jgi:heavy metal sensor kinase
VKSIRLSLVLYFFALLALALGAVSILAYQYCQRILQAKEDTRAQLLQGHHKFLRWREQHRLDELLERQARALADQMEIQYGRNRTTPGNGKVSEDRYTKLPPLRAAHMMAPLGGLVVPLDPVGIPVDLKEVLAASVWLTSHPRGPWSEHLLHMLFSEIVFHEPSPDPSVQVPEYFQINTTWGRHWQSRSMGDRAFAFDPALLQTMQLGDTKHDEIDLEPGIHLRRVLLKCPITTSVWQRPGPPRERPGPFPGRREARGSADESRPGPREQPPERREIRSPSVLIQFAAETTELEDKLAKLQGQLDQDLADLKEESRATLASLRNWFSLVGLATFAATVLGGFWLVGLGLAPLKRLSDAVSQVSVKDFRLPLDESRLPAELRPITERLTRTLDLLKRAFAREKQAAADISHELRTPLAALLTTIEVALRKPRPPDEYRELLTECHAAGQQMSQLVERLLALARLDAGVDTLRPRSVDVAVLAEQCANLVRPLADARELTLRVHRNGAIPLNTDPDKLREIVTNLLHNAIEYNQPKGSVDLTVERENGHLRLEVRDTGIGIAPEAREHIFERFYRADASRHAEGLHAGLGLSIVKGYVDLMGGTITVESDPGKGSSFRLELPA